MRKCPSPYAPHRRPGCCAGTARPAPALFRALPTGTSAGTFICFAAAPMVFAALSMGVAAVSLALAAVPLDVVAASIGIAAVFIVRAALSIVIAPVTIASAALSMGLAVAPIAFAAVPVVFAAAPIDPAAAPLVFAATCPWASRARGPPAAPPRRACPRGLRRPRWPPRHTCNQLPNKHYEPHQENRPGAANYSR